MAPACIIDAPQTGQHVKIEPLSSHSYYAGCQALPVTDPARDHRGEVERPRARHTPSAYRSRPDARARRAIAWSERT